MFKRKAVALDVTQSPSPFREAKKEGLKSLQMQAYKDNTQAYENETLILAVPDTYSERLNNLYHVQCLDRSKKQIKFRDCQPAPFYKTCSSGGMDHHNTFYVSKDGNSVILCVVLDLGEGRVEYHFSAKNICVCLSGVSKVNSKPVQSCHFWIVSISRKKCPRDVYRELNQSILNGPQRMSVNFMKRVSTGVFNFASMTLAPLKLAGMVALDSGAKILSENPYTFIQLSQNRLDTSLLQWLGQKELFNRAGATKIPSIAAVLFLSCSITILGAKFILSCCRKIRNAVNRSERAVSALVFCVGIFVILSSLVECWDMISVILTPALPNDYAFELMHGAAMLSQRVINPCVNFSCGISIIQSILEQLKIISAPILRSISSGGSRVLEAGKRASAAASATLSWKKAMNPATDSSGLEAQRETVEDPDKERTTSSSAQGLRQIEESTIQITQDFLKKLGVPQETEDALLVEAPVMFAHTRPLFEKNNLKNNLEENKKIEKARATLAILSVALLNMAEKGSSASLKEITDGVLSLQDENVISLGIAPEPDLFFLLPSQIYLQNLIFLHRIFAINAVIDMLTDFLNRRLSKAERETLTQDMVLFSSRNCPADWIDTLGSQACSSRDCGV